MYTSGSQLHSLTPKVLVVFLSQQNFESTHLASETHNSLYLEARVKKKKKISTLGVQRVESHWFTCTIRCLIIEPAF